MITTVPRDPGAIPGTDRWNTLLNGVTA